MATTISTPVTEQPAAPRTITCVRNLVAGEVTLQGAGGEIHLAPLAARQLSSAEAATLEERLVDCQYVALASTPARPGAGLVHRGADGVGRGTRAPPRVDRRVDVATRVLGRHRWGGDDPAAEVRGGGRRRQRLATRQGGPDPRAGHRVRAARRVALLFATHLFDELRPDVGAALKPPLSATVILRLLQVLFLGVAITFPAVLYFLFDRQRAGTLRKRFVLHIFRFDPRVKTRSDVDAFYGRQMDEAFGARPSSGRRRRCPVRHRAPMVVTTVVLAVGWIVASINLYALDPDKPVSIANLFHPDASVLAFGFLGAYFFAVNSVIRSYVRGDLQPKSYSQITARVLVVVVLTALLAVTDWGNNRGVIAIAFFAGIVPDTILQLVWERTRRLVRTKGHDNSSRTNRSRSSTASTSTSVPDSPARE